MMLERSLFTSLALWTLLLGPGLCLAGTLQHLCTDCSEGSEIACEHEEDCANDPCADVVLRLDSESIAWKPVPPLAVVPSPGRPAPYSLDMGPIFQELPPLPEKNLPRPESEFPLLI
jgi:hypothetical protein